ncbi:MAG: cobyrinate a,c-diamide synthase [Proteobacteria bacterium]|nr:cobyrinate a,c-diamide synthase [Pseudomonadota bacterium]MDA1355641.1 cobyrinate a,c-diamide synthase [Pseudomonadota bacterium]
MSAARGLIIAAPKSGSGKTILTLGLLRQWTRSGIAAAPFKVGPDYIDAAYHAAAAGRACANLDSWAMRGESLDVSAAALAQDAEFILGEGVMGLFDGAAGGGGATADLAAHFCLPVVLVIDVRGQGASVAALAQGFASHRADVEVAAVIFNHVASPRHEDILRSAMALTGIAVLGALPRDAALALPARHLGLVQAGESEDLEAFLNAAADHVARHVDSEGLRALGRPLHTSQGAAPPCLLQPLGRKIAVARDVAFAFSYEAVLAGWRQAGAALSFFSPLADEAPDAGADAIYLPGGYPELHAGRLAANSNFMGGLRRAAQNDVFIYGECGGYMVLGDGLIDAAGQRHAMAGLLPLETSFAAPRLHLGYRETEMLRDTPLAARGAQFRGHEFHYAAVTQEDGAHSLFRCSDSGGKDLGNMGLAAGAVMGSFIHLIDRR